MRKKHHADLELDNSKVEALNKQLGGFDAKTLYAILSEAQDVFKNSRLIFGMAMQAFEAASNPVQQLILSLKRTKDAPLNEATKPFKVFKAYAESGVSVDRHAAIQRQFFMVIRHICPAEEDKHIQGVVEVTSIQDYIRASEKKDIEEELEKLEERFLRLDEKLRSESQDLEALAKDNKELEKDIEAKEKENEPEDEDKSSRKARKEALKEQKDKLKEDKKEHRTQLAAWKKDYQARFKTEFRIMHMVFADVASVYNGVKLENGLETTQLHLSCLLHHFQGPFQDFRKEASSLSSQTRPLSVAA
jgi:hypothetical protein